VDLFVKNGNRDEQLAKNPAPGDLDMIISPLDGALVVVAQVGGAHVCGFCLDPEHLFVQDPSHPHRAVEWNPPDGLGTRIMLHACCVSAAARVGGKLIVDRERGHQLRRFATKVEKAVGGGSSNGG